MPSKWNTCPFLTTIPLDHNTEEYKDRMILNEAAAAAAVAVIYWKEIALLMIGNRHNQLQYQSDMINKINDSLLI